jgi:cell division protein FtsA
MARSSGIGADQVVGVVDVGSQKVCCLVMAVPTAARRGREEKARVLGIGLRRAEGVRAGTVTGLDAAEASIRAAVAEAERAAGVDLTRVVVPVACGRVASRAFTASTPLAGPTVRPDDIRRIAAAARDLVERDARALVHLDWAPFRLDSLDDIDDPLGMAGRSLAADLVAVSADRAAVGNLTVAVERAQLEVVRAVPAALASALATTTAIERRDGVVVIDVGAGVTKFAHLAHDRLLHTSGLAVGGRQTTDAIAREFGLEQPRAERIKVLCGTLLHRAGGATVASARRSGDRGADGRTGPMGEDEDRAALAAVVRRGIAQWTGLVTERLDEIERSSPVWRRRGDGSAGMAIVLTGGGAQLDGLAEALAEATACPVRLGAPLLDQGLAGVAGEPEQAPELATAFGALSVSTGPVQGVAEGDLGLPGGGGLVSRMVGWVRESF